MKLLISIISCFLLLGCQEYEFADMEESRRTACGKKAEDMPWLKKLLETYNAQDHACPILQVEQGIYKKETVFLVYAGGPACLTCGAEVVDCEGETVFTCDREEEKKIKKRQLIWEKK